MKEAVIVEALRTPMGRHGGILKDVRTDDLGAYIIAKLMTRPELTKKNEDVYFGLTNQAGEDSRNVARNASLLAELPIRFQGHSHRFVRVRIGGDQRGWTSHPN